MKFRHYKGGIYDWVGEATMESDLTPMVVYRAQDGTMWVRPKAVFFEELETGSGKVSRFSPIDALPGAADG